MDDHSKGECPAEMAVVDTFTRLIFGEESDFDAQEQSIIQALRLVDANVAGDSLHDMGDYLRSLEVSEMIELVARVKERLAAATPVIGVGERPARAPQVRQRP